MRWSQQYLIIPDVTNVRRKIYFLPHIALNHSSPHHWVVATVQYSRVLERIEPMEVKLAQANEILAGAQVRLQECKEELRLSKVFLGNFRVVD